MPAFNYVKRAMHVALADRDQTDLFCCWLLLIWKKPTGDWVFISGYNLQFTTLYVDLTCLMFEMVTTCPYWICSLWTDSNTLSISWGMCMTSWLWDWTILYITPHTIEHSWLQPVTDGDRSLTNGLGVSLIWCCWVEPLDQSICLLNG